MSGNAGTNVVHARRPSMPGPVVGDAGRHSVPDAASGTPLFIRVKSTAAFLGTPPAHGASIHEKNSSGEFPSQPPSLGSTPPPGVKVIAGVHNRGSSVDTVSRFHPSPSGLPAGPLGTPYCDSVAVRAAFQCLASCLCYIPRGIFCCVWKC